MKKSRVLIVHPRVTSKGGGNLVAAYAIQSLCREHDVTVATLEPVDCEALNRSFGTSMRPEDFKVRIAASTYQTILRALPTPGALAELCLTVRWAQDLDRLEHYDVLFSTNNEADFHRAGIQYVHYPWLYMPRPEPELTWYHRIPGMLPLYRKACMTLGRATRAGLGRNLTLANSGFVAGKIHAAYGTTARIIWPPVPGKFQDTPWEQRRLAIAAVGRIHPGKRWDEALEIVERVRGRGHDLVFTLMGHVDSVEYSARLEALAATRPWFRFLRDLDRSQLLAELAQHRYGIHPMVEEHFGIAPAELQRAGCIIFVHNSGGPVEIVGGDRRLTFDGVEEASGKIANVLENPELERELVNQLAERKEWFTEARFCDSLREIVTQFPVGQASGLPH